MTAAAARQPPLREQSFADDSTVMVSICCITFNHAKYIDQCLAGFLEQRCDFRVEILIYDDASSDGTDQIIRAHAARHPTVFRTFLMTENQYSKGVNPYFGYVFPAARGRYIAVCDGDDFWSDPDKLACQVAVLEAEPDIALTYGAVYGIDDYGTDIPYKGGVTHDLTAAELRAGPPINTLTTCFRNIFSEVTVPLYPRTATIGDLMVWAMLGYHGGARFLPELAPASYRIRAGGLISMQARKQQLMMTAVARMHMAGYHADQNDTAAMDAAMHLVAKHFNSIGNGALVYQPQSRLSLPRRIRQLWKSLRTRRKSMLRWLRGS